MSSFLILLFACLIVNSTDNFYDLKEQIVKLIAIEILIWGLLYQRFALLNKTHTQHEKKFIFIKLIICL